MTAQFKRALCLKNIPPKWFQIEIEIIKKPRHHGFYSYSKINPNFEAFSWMEKYISISSSINLFISGESGMRSFSLYLPLSGNDLYI